MFISQIKRLKSFLKTGWKWDDNIFGMENGETKDIEILFKSGDSLYWIKLDNCLYENSKWFSGSPNAWGLDDDDQY